MRRMAGQPVPAMPFAAGQPDGMLGMAAAQDRIPAWSWAAPLVALGLLFAPATGWVLAPIGLALAATVFAAVHHAEVVAHRLGEPFGTLVLALAVTVIETALIVSLMLAPGAEKAELARDTVFAAVMIVGNGIVGFCLLVGGARHREQGYNLSGTAALLAVLVALSVLTLVLPAHTTSIAGPRYTGAQLVFVATVSLLLYGTFLFVQTIRHRDYFLPAGPVAEEAHAPPPPARTAWASFGLLLPCLAAVVLLAKAVSPAVQAAVVDAGWPLATVGVAIALLVLLPEGLAAVNAARRDRLQTALNLALGSALCTIGLTIPAVAALCLAMDLPLSLGLAAKEQVLLALTVALSVLTLATTGRTTVLQGVVHLVVFATFLFLTVVP